MDKPGKAPFEGQTVLPGHTPGVSQAAGRERPGRGQGGTYDPEAVEGHVGMEALQVLQPPLLRVRVGEVCEGSEAGPDLRGHPKPTGSAGRQLAGGPSQGTVCHGAVSVPKDQGVKRAIKQKIKPG